MPARRSARATREQGLERTDNDMEFSSWPQATMINQKNYYTEYLKRDDQILVLRLQNEENRSRMTKAARDKDRALAHSAANEQPGVEADVDMDDQGVADEGSGTSSDPEANGSKVIVIHPGSQNLRIGLASDALPKTVPMIIARKSRENESEGKTIEPRPKRRKVDEESSEESQKHFDDDFHNLSTNMSVDLKGRMRKKGRRIVPNCKEVAIGFNRKTPPSIISEHNDSYRIEWTDVSSSSHGPDHFTGKAALRIPDASRPRYKLLRPLRQGCFNEADYTSKDELLRDFSLVLEEAIINQLGLARRRDWQQYSCVFVIPDLYDRNYVTAVLELLMRNFGFSRVCFIQESLSGSYGAGFATCVIVDVGAEKTSVCCVDEGMCLENSRVNLKFGGKDVSETFVRLMIAAQFPYRELDVNRRYDFLLAEELKQKFCTLSVQDFTAQQYEFYLRIHEQNTRHYLFKAYDEVILAPMGFFQPAIFDHSDKLKGQRSLMSRSSDLYDGSPNDPLSAAQMQVLALASAENSPIPRDQAALVPPDASITRPASSKIKSTSLEPGLLANSPTKEESETPRATEFANSLVTDKDQSAEQLILQAEMLKLDKTRETIVPAISLTKAIAFSIEQGAKGEDRKMRDFFGGIIPVGGGAQIPNFNQFLEEELSESQVRFKKDIMVAPPPREIDAQVLVWKGASIFGKLQGTNDTWISAMEYDRLGSRLLAYKCGWNW